jgi:hypothetical protein
MCRRSQAEQGSARSDTTDLPDSWDQGKRSANKGFRFQAANAEFSVVFDPQTLPGWTLLSLVCSTSATRAARARCAARLASEFLVTVLHAPRRVDQAVSRWLVGGCGPGRDRTCDPGIMSPLL